MFHFLWGRLVANKLLQHNSKALNLYTAKQARLLKKATDLCLTLKEPEDASIELDTVDLLTKQTEERKVYTVRRRHGSLYRSSSAIDLLANQTQQAQLHTAE